MRVADRIGSGVRRSWRVVAVRLIVTSVVWSTIALVFAAQGWWFARMQGAPQPWWPSFGYAAAIFSVWWLLTLPLAVVIERIESSRLTRTWRIAVYLAGFPVVTALHVAIFALLYWPVYNDAGRIPTVWAMAKAMLVPNVHTNLVFYGGLVILVAVGSALARHRRNTEAGAASKVEASPASGTLHIRSRGALRAIPFDDIAWVVAAGDYAEVGTATGLHLVDQSLSALQARLPADAFARIHRKTILRLALIREVRSQGRGDALVRLADGTEFRLSRRYRGGLARWLDRP